MQLIIGLGNPGEKYQDTRHNAGFLMLDYLKENLNFSNFKFDKKFNAEITENGNHENFSLLNLIKSTNTTANQNKIILAKPQTFMNNSGQTTQALINFYKITPEEIVVIHDELDLSLGKFKISKGKNAAGHNGILSIINHLGTKDFTRIRIGVDNRNEAERKNISGSNYVLGRFQNKELEILKDVFQKIEGELK